MTRESTVLGGLRAVVHDHPDRIAVLGPDGRLTYAELDERTDRLAMLLAGYGAGPDRCVGVLLPRSVDLVVAIVAILKAGAVYVPLDPEQPAQRLAAIAEDARPVAMLTHAPLADRVPCEGLPVVHLDTVELGGVERAPVLDPHPESLAYVIFTSGSTGRPKGVEISHRSLAGLLSGLEAAGVYTDRGARVGWNASVSFDASVQQWVRVFRGDTLAVLPEETRRDAESFAAFVDTHELSVVDMTPSHAAVLLEELEAVARSGRRGLSLLVGGEAIAPALWSALGALADEGVLRAINLYGPTETTVDAVSTPVLSGHEPHLGAPLPGVGVRVVDADLREVADGAPGELCLTGDGLARGYAGRPGLTAARFVPDPAGGGGRMYRTGDRVRRGPDGALTYLGRADNQVKVRGYRVELGEVESVLDAGPAVAKTVVVLTSPPDGPALHAFVELTPGATLAQVRDHAAEHLASWMQPGAYTVVEAFPRTTSGKIDRAALTALAQPAGPAAADPADPAEVADVADVEPDSLEELVAAVWAEVLGVDSVAPTDDFFCIGGHSLSAMQVTNRLRTRLEVKIPTRLLFTHRTAAAFATAVAERRVAASA